MPHMWFEGNSTLRWPRRGSGWSRTWSGEGGRDALGDRIRVPAGALLALGLDHHADDRLGARGPDEHPPGAIQGLLVRADGVPNLAGVVEPLLVRDLDVHEHLWEATHRGRELADGDTPAARERQEAHRRDQPVPRRGLIAEDHVPRLLAAERHLVLQHLFEH